MHDTRVDRHGRGGCRLGRDGERRERGLDLVGHLPVVEPDAHGRACGHPRPEHDRPGRRVEPASDHGRPRVGPVGSIGPIVARRGTGHRVGGGRPSCRRGRRRGLVAHPLDEAARLERAEGVDHVAVEHVAIDARLAVQIVDDLGHGGVAVDRGEHQCRAGVEHVGAAGLGGEHDAAGRRPPSRSARGVRRRRSSRRTTGAGDANGSKGCTPGLRAPDARWLGGRAPPATGDARRRAVGPRSRATDPRERPAPRRWHRRRCGSCAVPAPRA